jgi:hypothetical protein
MSDNLKPSLYPDHYPLPSGDTGRARIGMHDAHRDRLTLTGTVDGVDGFTLRCAQKLSVRLDTHNRQPAFLAEPLPWSPEELCHHGLPSQPAKLPAVLRRLP